MDRGARRATVHRVAEELRHNLATKEQHPQHSKFFFFKFVTLENLSDFEVK